MYTYEIKKHRGLKYCVYHTKMCVDNICIISKYVQGIIYINTKAFVET